MEKPVNAKKTTLTILKYLPKPLLFTVRKRPSCGDSTKPKTAHRRKTSGFEPQEPASPKVSCMGQIKHRTKAGKQRRSSAAMRSEAAKPFCNAKKMFQNKVKPSPDVGEEMVGLAAPVAPARAPSIGEMKRFSGGRDALRGFAWTAVRPSDISEDQEKMGVTQSAPLLVEARKEINLWKRRPMPPPAPLLIMN